MMQLYILPSKFTYTLLWMTMDDRVVHAGRYSKDEHNDI